MIMVPEVKIEGQDSISAWIHASFFSRDFLQDT